MAAPKLHHTIQTRVGMVLYQGHPHTRYFDPQCHDKYIREAENSFICKVKGKAPIWDSPSVAYDLFTQCVLNRRLPDFENYSRSCSPWWRRLRILARDSDNPNQDIKSLCWNILACRDLDADLSMMKRNIANPKRLDLEQAAAIVLSAIVNDKCMDQDEKASIVGSLIRAIDHTTLIHSCMWMAAADLEELQGSKFSRFILFVNRVFFQSSVDISHVQDWESLVPFLLLVRRCRPADKSRCLFIPAWIFDSTNMEPPNTRPILNAQDRFKPGDEPTDSSLPSNAIVLSRKNFRSLQRRILAYHQYWKPSTVLRKAIHDLENDTLYNISYLKRHILPSNSTLLVCHAFISLQRRLQRKIVSNIYNVFLPKGTSGEFLQNRPNDPTAFEVELSKASGQANGIPIHGATLPQIDHCCLLMERYVDVYGNGNGANLVFRPGVRSGSGRGPVDDYNLLCDILSLLRTKAADERRGNRGISIGPVRKFLAKDIMSWNNGWADDAFADGFVPGWVPWLEMRRGRGLLLSEWEVLDAEEDEMTSMDKDLNEAKVDLRLR